MRLIAYLILSAACSCSALLSAPAPNGRDREAAKKTIAMYKKLNRLD